ncbi:uncharacterized protein LOC107982123 [Nasonia vitripennis]|uniref:Integrase zinc-binding domain-containing protein n=1 Tax=Nasonia vitripennis TaxID=7425 RepID=A0A7M7J220_NASVI|nr:uncharacterized protein LOC107982123 [Nasonia vitripennis]
MSSPGFKEGVVLVTALTGSYIYSGFSDYGCLVRSIGYILRWRKGNLLTGDVSTSSRSSKGIRYLSPEEIAQAERNLLLLIQQEKFAPEIKLLQSKNPRPYGKSSGAFKNRTKFDEINPFFYSDGLIRVGGRLKNYNLPFNQKHPILLPSAHHVSDLIIRDVHHRNLHSGIQSTLYAVRERFWILNDKNQFRIIVYLLINAFPRPDRISGKDGIRNIFTSSKFVKNG